MSEEQQRGSWNACFQWFSNKLYAPVASLIQIGARQLRSFQTLSHSDEAGVGACSDRQSQTNRKKEKNPNLQQSIGNSAIANQETARDVTATTEWCSASVKFRLENWNPALARRKQGRHHTQVFILPDCCRATKLSTARKGSQSQRHHYISYVLLATSEGGGRSPADASVGPSTSWITQPLRTSVK